MKAVYFVRFSHFDGSSLRPCSREFRTLSEAKSFYRSFICSPEFPTVVIIKSYVTNGIISGQSCLAIKSAFFSL